MITLPNLSLRDDHDDQCNKCMIFFLGVRKRFCNNSLVNIYGTWYSYLIGDVCIRTFCIFSWKCQQAQLICLLPDHSFDINTIYNEPELSSKP